MWKHAADTGPIKICRLDAFTRQHEANISTLNSIGDVATIVVACVESSGEFACLGKRLALHSRPSSNTSRWRVGAEDLVLIDLSEAWHHANAWYSSADADVVVLGA